MENAQYADATVLLFDRSHVVRKQTRSVLNVLGFKTFLEFSDLEEVRHVLKTQSVAVAVMNIDEIDCGVLDLVREIRRMRCGMDPFMPILLTTWGSKLSAVQPLIDSGADDVLLYPFSTNQMGQRIEALVHDRKPYIVTEDYLGPDRRSATETSTDPATVVVPNALQAHVQGNREAAPSVERIEETLMELRLLKLRNMARRVWFTAKTVKTAAADPNAQSKFKSELENLRKSIEVYHRTLIADDHANLKTLSRSLWNVISSMNPAAPEAKSLDLLEKNAMALRVASKLDHEDSDLSDAISDEVSKVASVDRNKVESNLIRAVMV